MRFVTPRYTPSPMFADPDGPALWGYSIPIGTTCRVTFAEYVSGNWREIPRNKWPRRNLMNIRKKLADVA